MRYLTNVLLAGVLYAVVSCGDDPAGPTRTDFVYQGVTFRARLEDGPSPGSFRVFVSGYNRGSTTVTFTIAGPCFMKPRLYRDGRLAFDGVTAFPLCPNDVYNFTLPAGDSVPDVWGSLIGPELLGDSLPAGRYRIVAALRPEGVGGPLHEIFAGNADF